MAFRVPLVLIVLVMGTLRPAMADPRPGDVYREYARHNGGDRDWRVTDVDAVIKFPRAEHHLPNSVLTLEIDDLEHAVRAEALIDRWGGHRGTINKRVRFNEKTWVTIPEIGGTPDGIRPEMLMFQDNPVVEIPLDDLVEGVNTFEGACDEAGGFGWGQWGLYSLVLRVYYDANKKADRCAMTARITSPASGATFGDDPTVSVEADGKNGIARIDVLAHTEDYDFDGDGQFVEWQESHFQLVRGGDNEIRDHVGTLWAEPYSLTWNTHWVPDQKPRSVKLIARVQDAFGYWTVTEPVDNLTLARDDVSVQLYRATGVPEDFDVRVDETKSCAISVPENAALRAATDAAIHLRTWHGDRHEHSPLRFNEHEFPANGKNHHFDYDLLTVPPSAIRRGENTFAIHSSTEHHMLEVLWPGPALVVRYDKNSDSQAKKPMPLHPQAQAFVEQLAADNPPGWHQMPVDEARKIFNTFGDLGGPAPELASVEDRVVGDGVPVRIYRPSDAKGLTPVVYFHGGGWVLGNVDTHDALCRRLADESGAVIFSVDYRLAPEHPFPAPLNDCFEATRAIAAMADELGVDVSKLIVGGDSAGGNLATAVSMRARDEGGPTITRQLLLYPVVAASFGTDSYKTFADGHGLTRDAMVYFWECYVGTDVGSAPPLADLSKLSSEDLRGLPPADVFLASHDVLHDEGVTFAKNLIDAGVTVSVKEYPGTLHGFVHFAGLFDDGIAGTSDVAAVIKSH